MWPFRAVDRQVPFMDAARTAIDDLRLVGREATRATTESLGRLAGGNVKLTAGEVALVPVHVLPALLQDAHQDADVSATTSFAEGAEGCGALLLDDVAARRLVDLLLGKPRDTTKALDELELSALAETANIGVNAAVTAASAMSGVSLRTRPPETGFDVHRRLQRLTEPPGDQDHAVVITTRFAEEASGVAGSVVLVFFVHAGA